MTDKPDPRQSSLAVAIAERATSRRSERFEIDQFFGFGDKPVPAVVIRVPTKWEQDNAVDLAAKYAKSVASDEDARKDADILEEAKLMCLAWHACRDAEDPKYPAFPDATWMAKHLTAEQIRVLVNLINGVRAAHAPTPEVLDPAALDAIVSACGELGDTDLPDKVLGGWRRAFLAHAFVALAMRADRDRRTVEMLQAVVDRVRETAPEVYANALPAVGGVSSDPEVSPELEIAPDAAPAAEP